MMERAADDCVGGRITLHLQNAGTVNRLRLNRRYRRRMFYAQGVNDYMRLLKQPGTLRNDEIAGIKLNDVRK